MDTVIPEEQDMQRPKQPPPPNQPERKTAFLPGINARSFLRSRFVRMQEHIYQEEQSA
jgi:hypothetical protein